MMKRIIKLLFYTKDTFKLYVAIQKIDGFLFNGFAQFDRKM